MKRAILLGAVACVALFALPAVASAGVWHVQNPSIGFSGTGGTGELTVKEGSGVHCTSVTVNGAYETTTTGQVEFTFHGCTGPFGVHCQTTGEPTGTIKTTKLTFHNVLAAGNVPALLLTPNHTTNNFAHFTCFGIPITVDGNGLIGTLNKNCGETTGSATVGFNSTSPGVPSPTQVTGSGTQYTLESTQSGVARMASEDASGTIAFNEGATQKIECTGV